jgi:cell division protein FtsB
LEKENKKNKEQFIESQRLLNMAHEDLRILKEDRKRVEQETNTIEHIHQEKQALEEQIARLNDELHFLREANSMNPMDDVSTTMHRQV